MNPNCWWGRGKGREKLSLHSKWFGSTPAFLPQLSSLCYEKEETACSSKWSLTKLHAQFLLWGKKAAAAKNVTHLCWILAQSQCSLLTAICWSKKYFINCTLAVDFYLVAIETLEEKLVSNPWTRFATQFYSSI